MQKTVFAMQFVNAKLFMQSGLILQKKERLPLKTYFREPKCIMGESYAIYRSSHFVDRSGARWNCGWFLDITRAVSKQRPIRRGADTFGQ